MDAHLIGIELAQLLLKQNARAERQRQVNVAGPAAESTAIKEQTRAKSR
jgi:hypothetical protein